jgi:hypothetical protein
VKRTFGMVFMVVGGIGLVVSLLLVPAVWIGRSYVNDQIAALAGGVGGPVVQVEESVGELRGRVDALRGRIREVGQQVTTAADRGTIDQQAADRLVALLDATLGAEFARLREAYVSMRERLRFVVETRGRIQRLLPGFSVPGPPTDELATVDQDLQAIDAALRQMRANLAEGALPGTSLPPPGRRGPRAAGSAPGCVASRVRSHQRPAGRGPGCAGQCRGAAADVRDHRRDRLYPALFVRRRPARGADCRRALVVAPRC